MEEELLDLLRTVSAGRPMSRRQLRVAVRRRGLVRMWDPEGGVVEQWEDMVSRGVARAELTPRGREELARADRHVRQGH
jgi:hypothetical protein